MYKVIAVDSLCRDYHPQMLVTMAMSKDNATRIADLLNGSICNGIYHMQVVPATKVLNLESKYDLVDELMPYEVWLNLTGASALPQHVAEYWYNTTIVKHLDYSGE